ncbi:Chitin binding domain [Trinorchestia longiramus]|nr:Chitin binding domain [Trinorchestia longiramus]
MTYRTKKSDAGFSVLASDEELYMTELLTRIFCQSATNFSVFVMFQCYSFGTLLLILSSAVAVTVNSKCEPTCEGVTESGTQVMDPSNCLGYYVCVQVGEEFVLSEPLQCSEGYYFDINLVPPQCDLITSAHGGFCEGYCNPCEVQCSVTGTLRPDPLNCTQFYLCLEEGASTLLTCSGSTPYFDYTNEVCQPEKSLCYDYCDKTSPYCVEPGIVVPVEPESCQNYYFCDPPNLTPFSCAEDECFDLDAETCKEN